MFLRVGTFLWISFAGLVVACGGPPDPLSNLARGEEGRVVRVMDGDALALETGQSVRLVGLEAPSFGRNDEPDQPHADRSKRALEDLVLGRTVRLYYPGLTRDKYDRALAHVKTIDDRGPKLWVNLALVESGAGRVRAYPDTAPLTDILIEAEVIARAEKLGLWRESAYAPLAASELTGDEVGFYLINVEIEGPVPTDRPGQLCAKGLRRSNLRLIADPPAPSLCDALPGEKLLARGYVTRNRLYVTHDLNLQVAEVD
ncbi:MAG: thermonuclease family protein [Pseudomonadota bacterium]